LAIIVAVEHAGVLFHWLVYWVIAGISKVKEKRALRKSQQLKKTKAE
jgi:hypothetical protein